MRLSCEICPAVMIQMDYAAARRNHVEMLAGLIRLRDASIHPALYDMLAHLSAYLPCTRMTDPTGTWESGSSTARPGRPASPVGRYGMPGLSSQRHKISAPSARALGRTR
jgi:hypothetical protein